MELLLKAGAVFDFRAAVLCGDNRIIKEFLDEEYDVEGRNPYQSTYGESALMLAAALGYMETVNLLLAYGADPNAANIHGETALILAAINGNAEMLVALLEGGADVNFIPFNGEAALLRAANVHIVRLLLEYGAEINGGGSNHNIFSRYGWTALMVAAIENDLSRVMLLLESGADVNHQDSQGWSALMYAAEKGYEDILTALLAHGAKRELENEDDQTAIDIARIKHQRIIALMENDQT